MLFRATWRCFGGSENGFAVTGGMFYAGAVSGGSQTGIICGLSSTGGFLVPALFIHIPTFASTLVSKGGAVCGNSARTDLCGGWAAMLIPTATHCRGITWRARRDDDRSAGAPRLCALQNTHRIGRPLCLENPRPKGGMLIHALRPPVSTHHHRAFALWLNLAQPKWPPSPAAAKHGYDLTAGD